MGGRPENGLLERLYRLIQERAGITMSINELIKNNVPRNNVLLQELFRTQNRINDEIRTVVEETRMRGKAL